MKEFEVNWKSADIPPKETGSYLVLTKSGYFTELEYSKKHNLWNALDCLERTEALKHAIIEIIAYCENTADYRKVIEEQTW